MHAFLIALTAPAPLELRDLAPTSTALAPIAQLAFVLQCGAVGTALGSVIALRAKRRYGDADTWSITTAWATVALFVGVAVALVTAIA